MRRLAWVVLIVAVALALQGSYRRVEVRGDYFNAIDESAQTPVRYFDYTTSGTPATEQGARIRKMVIWNNTGGILAVRFFADRFNKAGGSRLIVLEDGTSRTIVGFRVAAYQIETIPGSGKAYFFAEA